ncbi:MAG: hypothetical protein U1E87_01880 [Alphaproteobacteria bacterium]
MLLLLGDGRPPDLQCARGVANAGGAILLPQREMTPSAWQPRSRAPRGDPAALVRMAAGGAGVGRPDAQSELADLVEDMMRADAKSDAPG